MQRVTCNRRCPPAALVVTARGWLWDLPALAILYEKLTLRGFVWDDRYHGIEDLTAAMDTFLAGVPDVIDFRVEFKATRQVELPFAAVTVGRTVTR